LDFNNYFNGGHCKIFFFFQKLRIACVRLRVARCVKISKKKKKKKKKKAKVWDSKKCFDKINEINRIRSIQ